MIPHLCKARPMLWGMALFFLFSITFLILMVEPFYEDGVYLGYFRSILEDGDLNLINQLPSSMTWMALENGYHPNTHSIIQTPSFFLFWGFERWLQPLFSRTSDFNFFLLSFFHHMSSLGVGFFCCQKIAKKFQLEIGVKEIVALLFGSALFYFGLQKYNVIEIYAFPLASYLFYQTMSDSISSRGFITGVFAGILCCIKLTFWPLVLLVFIKFLKERKLTMFSFLFGCLVVILLNNISMKARFGGTFDYTLFSSALMELSFEDILASLIQGQFFPGGVFFSSPLFFLCLIGIISFIRHMKRERKLDLISLLLMGSWLFISFFQTVPLIGYLLDDHLVGRHHLSSLPLLVLGLAFLKKRIEPSHKWLWSSLLIICSCVFFFNYLHYIGLESLGHHFYEKYKFLNKIQFLEFIGLFKKSWAINWAVIKHNWHYILFCCLFFGYALNLIIQKNKVDQLMQLKGAIWPLLFALIIILDLNNGQKKIISYKDKNLYQDKVIVRAGAICALDYLLDRANAVKMSGEETAIKKVDLAVLRLFEMVSNQVVRSTPSFDQAMKSVDSNISFLKHKN